ncbi:regulatory-associated protein of TOR 1-like isoform X3 [Humulus lupulus]|uniref:regulatory-associated protein of TOR 1-like isoform X3 n=1 Tax=Humulus lupulus TaxID=3486 RepID=UPI002B4011CF|nr:regulatory-associated protein of TOR 1-like isoform X3 [Humulus lupulus]
MKLLESYGRVEELGFFASLKEQYEILIHHFIQLHDWVASSSSGSTRDCILLGACEAHETLPQSAEFPADVFTSCLTTPIKMALRWFCRRSLLHESLDESLIDKIPGRQNDRKTLLGELNWIFTAVTNTVAWNVLPHGMHETWLLRYAFLSFRHWLKILLQSSSVEVRLSLRLPLQLSLLFG